MIKPIPSICWKIILFINTPKQTFTFINCPFHLSFIIINTGLLISDGLQYRELYKNTRFFGNHYNTHSVLNQRYLSRVPANRSVSYAMNELPYQTLPLPSHDQAWHLMRRPKVNWIWYSNWIKTNLLLSPCEQFSINII